MLGRDEKYQHGDPPVAAALPESVIISPDTRRGDRVPPGQTRTRKWPVLDASGTPHLPTLDDWSLEVFGCVDQPLRIGWAEFQAWPRVQVFGDFHCVTRWSRLGNLWEGIAVRSVLARAQVRPEARYVILHAHDCGWTTNLPLVDFDVDDALLADRHDGQPLTPDHGGPVRAIVPRLYAWKSAKWLKGIELSEVDRPGYWERAGYHDHGDPWVVSERYPDGERFG